MSWSVLYYETVEGDKPIETFLNALSSEARAKSLAYISRLKLTEHNFRLRSRRMSAEKSGNFGLSGLAQSTGFFTGRSSASGS